MTFRLLMILSVFIAGKMYAHDGRCDQLPREIDAYNLQLLRHQKTQEVKEGIRAVQEAAKNVVSNIVHGVEKVKNKPVPQEKSALVADYISQVAKNVSTFTKNNSRIIIAASGIITVTTILYKYIKSKKTEERRKEVA